MEVYYAIYYFLRCVYKRRVCIQSSDAELLWVICGSSLLAGVGIRP